MLILLNLTNMTLFEKLKTLLFDLIFFILYYIILHVNPECISKSRTDIPHLLILFKLLFPVCLKIIILTVSGLERMMMCILV